MLTITSLRVLPHSAVLELYDRHAGRLLAHAHCSNYGPWPDKYTPECAHPRPVRIDQARRDAVGIMLDNVRTVGAPGNAMGLSSWHALGYQLLWGARS